MTQDKLFFYQKKKTKQNQPVSFHISDEMGGTVSAKEGAKPKVTTTAATTTTSIPSSTYNTAQNMTCKLEF